MRWLLLLIAIVLLPTLWFKEPENKPSGLLLVEGKPLRQKSAAEAASELVSSVSSAPLAPRQILQTIAADADVVPTTSALRAALLTGDISFELLGGFPYDIDTSDASMSLATEIYKARLDQQIPQQVLGLQNQAVSIVGYMIPIDFFEGRVLSFVLVSSPMACCFGVIPRINEWVHVVMDKPGISSLLVDMPLKVSGVLDIGAQIEDGAVMSVYRLKGTEVKPAGEKHR